MANHDYRDPDDGGEVVYLGPGVYSGEPAQCTAPCRFVLPPSALPSKTTISIPPYTTSIRDSSGSTHTVTITVPAITTDEINYYNVNVTSSQKSGYSFMAIPSVDVNPVTTTFTFGGTTQVRTLTLPPWPAITHGPGFEWNTTTPEDGDDGHIENPVFPPPVTTLPEWPSKTPFVDWNDDEPTGTWPEMEVRPLYSDVPDEGEDDDGDGQKHKTTCKLWFFWVGSSTILKRAMNTYTVQICINWGEIDIHIGGWEWNLPVGIWGPYVETPTRLLQEGKKCTDMYCFILGDHQILPRSSFPQVSSSREHSRHGPRSRKWLSLSSPLSCYR